MTEPKPQRPVASHTAPQEEPLIRFDRVSKRFGDNVVLDEVSFSIPRGSICVLMGPSGTGKSVLLRCMVGLMQPDSGRIEVDGVAITHLQEHPGLAQDTLAGLRRRLGMLFQDGALLDDLTVAGNVAFPLKMHSDWSPAQIDAKVHDCLARVGLAGKETLMPSELSGGMRKRVAFARAIVLDPTVVLCDEPSSGLDPVMAATLDELILELHASLKTSFVIISHDTQEAMRVATHMGLLYRGKLLAFGPKEQVIQQGHPALVQFMQRSPTGPITVL